ncbi:MAG: phospholipid-binding protein MlaC [Gammaproteobacteria bacterium]
MKHGFWRAALIASACIFSVSALGAPRLTPQEVVQNTAEQVLRILDGEQEKLKQDPERLHEVVEDYIVPNFSFTTMSRLVLGRHWQRANDRQREQFTQAFRSLLVTTYTQSLLDYTGVPIRYLPVHMGADADSATVRTEILPPARPPVAIGYRLRLIRGEWKVIDVVVEGVSLVTNYRTEFSTEISQRGLDGLIRSLEARAQSRNPPIN